MQAGAEVKLDGATVRGDFPGNPEAGLKGLSLAVQADQDTAREVANGFGSILLHQQWIESFRFAAKTEMEFAAGLAGRVAAGETGPAQGKGKGENNPNAAHHCVTSCGGRTS